MSWQWRMIQTLRRNWLVVLKLTWVTLQILTGGLKSLKNLCFNWLLVTKVYIVWATKEQRSYLSWHWRVMESLKKNWLVVWKKTWEIWQIFTRALESVKIGTLISHQIGTFVQSRKGMTLKFTEELCVMAMKNNAKFEGKLTCHFGFFHQKYVWAKKNT